MESSMVNDAGRRGAASERAAQIQAVYAVMRLLAEDDRLRVHHDHIVFCDACRRDRPAAGSVDYSGTRLCNGCATEYEVLRVSKVAVDTAGFLAKAGGAITLRS